MTKLSIFSALLLLASNTSAQDAEHTAFPAGALSSTSSLGQHDDDLQIPKRDKLIYHHGFYAAPTLGMTSFNHAVAPTVGVRAAWLANYQFGLGLAFNGVANELDERANYAGRAIGGYGGLFLQYIVGHDHRVHAALHTTVGGGSACQQNGSTGDDDCIGHSFFALEPMADIELDISPQVRLTVGGGYRLAVAASGSLSSHDLSGFVTKAALELGKF